MTFGKRRLLALVGTAVITALGMTGIALASTDANPPPAMEKPSLVNPRARQLVDELYVLTANMRETDRKTCLTEKDQTPETCLRRPEGCEISNKASDVLKVTYWGQFRDNGFALIVDTSFADVLYVDFRHDGVLDHTIMKLKMPMAPFKTLEDTQRQADADVAADDAIGSPASRSNYFLALQKYDACLKKVFSQTATTP